MTPHFALHFSVEGIVLDQRHRLGWVKLAEANFSSPTFTEDLSALRSAGQSAAAEAGVPFGCKLVLPNDQIKELVLRDDTPTQRSVSMALEGATPYALSELEFDWRAENGKTRIAAVAKETLEEALGFATENALSPIAFVALPSEGWSDTEAFFTTIDGAPAPKPLRDPAPYRRVDVAIAAPVGPELTIESDAVNPSEQEAGASEAQEKDLPAETDVADAGNRPTTEDIQNEATPSAPAPTDVPNVETVPQNAETASVTEHPSSVASVRLPEAGRAPALGAAPTVAPAFAPAPPPAARVGAPSVPSPSASDATPRLNATLGTTPGAATPLSAPTRPAFEEVPPQPIAPHVTNTKVPTDDHEATPIAAPDSIAEADIADMAASLGPDGLIPGTADTAETKNGVFAGFRSRRKAASEDLPERSPEATSAAIATRPRANNDRVRGKPKYLGLILTVILILVLLAVAAFAAVREDGLARFFGGSATPEVPDVPQSALAVPNTALPPVETTALAPVSIAPAPLAALGVDSAATPSTTPTKPQPSDVELERLYAATGIWLIVPPSPSAPAPSELESFYVTSIDGSVNTGDAVALSLVAGFDSDMRPASQPLPPAPGTRFTFDANGLLVATAEGAVSPLGYTVIAGRPSITPPVRIQEAAAPSQAGIARLAAFRPKLRPEGLIENAERVANGGFTQVELAAFRPRLRPASAQAAAEAAALAAAEADTESDEIAEESDYAVIASLRPESRPRNFSRVVAEAKASQPTEVAVAAPVTPRATQPSGPTRASVARAATTENAINLRRVNLIGVYGKTSNRSALVRLANGRFVKVQVGDRMDGGQVSAISESALRYVKRGRNVVLEIPSG